MYSKTACEEDDRMVERLKQSTEATLIFVSPMLAFVCHIFQLKIIDWFILCRHRCSAYSVIP